VVNFMPWPLYLWEDPGTHYLQERKVILCQVRNFLSPESLK